MAQDGHLYFENVGIVARAREGRPAFQIDVHGFRAVEAYLMRGDDRR